MPPLLQQHESGSLRLRAWTELLPSNYIHRDYILDGVEHGFNIVEPDRIFGFVSMRNHWSAVSNECKKMVEKAICTELNNGRYVVARERPRIVSPLAAIRKSNGDIRLIHDCSRPHGQSLNDAAVSIKVKYESLRDAEKFLEQGMYLCKVDLSTAYRSVKIHSSNYCATGLAWTFAGDKRPTVLIDTRLPFGASASCGIFNRLSQGVVAIMRAKGFLNVVSYLDDFLIGDINRDRCILALNTLIALLRQLGFGICYSKVEGPSTRLVFLGIMIDTVAMTYGLPSDKMQHLQAQINDTLSAATSTKRALQALIGKLNWASNVISGGRCFLRRIINHANALTAPHQRAAINPGVTEDLAYWQSVLQRCSHASPIFDERRALSIVVFAANGGVFVVYVPGIGGCRFVFDGRVCATYGVVLVSCFVLRSLAPRLSDTRVYIHTNIAASVAIFKNLSCSNKVYMQSLRELWKLSNYYNFGLHAAYYRPPSRYGNEFGPQAYLLRLQRTGEFDESGLPPPFELLCSVLYISRPDGMASVRAHYSSLRHPPFGYVRPAIYQMPPGCYSTCPPDGRPFSGSNDVTPGSLYLTRAVQGPASRTTSYDSDDTGTSTQLHRSSRPQSGGGHTVLGSRVADDVHTIAQKPHLSHIDALPRHQPPPPSRRSFRQERNDDDDNAQQNSQRIYAAKGYSSPSPEGPRALPCWRPTTCAGRHGVGGGGECIARMARWEALPVPPVFKAAPSAINYCGCGPGQVWRAQLPPWGSHIGSRHGRVG